MRYAEEALMVLPAAVVAMAMTVSGVTASDAEAFGAAVRAIRSADYRGARGELQGLTAALDVGRDPELAPYRHYWRGFAQWRRALNGFNETPPPADLAGDLTAAIASFEAALAAKPGWIEAKIGIVGCVGPLLYLARDDAARREALLKQFLPMAREVREEDANPRALWTVGQGQLGGGGGAAGPQPAAAALSFHRGIEASLAEARRAAGDEPAWIPRWGGAENLMNLAYLYTHSALANRDLALAYVEGALVAAPEWRFVREILKPQAEALPAPSSAASPREQPNAVVEHNKAVARKFLEQAFGPLWKVELVEALHTPDFVLHTASGDQGIEEDREALLGWKTATPDLVMRVDGIVGEGDTVAVRWTATGTNTGEGNGLPATGKRVSASGTTFWRLRDGKIAEEWGVVDMVSVLRQLGQLPARR